LWLYLRTSANNHALPASPTAALNSRSASRTAAALLPDGRTRPPALAPAQDSCSSLVDGIVLCLVAGSEVGEIHTEGPRRTVELKRGRAVASLEPQPAGTSFSITTSAGTVTAVGTIFSVEISH